MSDSSEYQRLIEDYPKLQNQGHKEAFDKFIARMWTTPTSFKHYLRAYLEFCTSEKPTFKRLDNLHGKIPQVGASVEQPGRRRRSGRRGRRSRRRQKQS